MLCVIIGRLFRWGFASGARTEESSLIKQSMMVTAQCFENVRKILSDLALSEIISSLFLSL